MNKYQQGYFAMGRCFVIVTKDAGKWHLSISCANDDPTYNEIKAARYQFIPDNVYMAQIFPPRAEFVNLHPHCFHLWEI